MSCRTRVRDIVLSGGQRFSWRRATPDDANIVWQWWNAPHAHLWSAERRLATFGEPPYTQEHVRCYLQATASPANFSAPQRDRSLAEPLIGCLADSGPIVYAELYWREGSPLASSPLLDLGVRGMHMVVGKTSGHPRWMVAEICSDILDWQFTEHSEMTQAIADPDVRNAPMKVLCERLGMREIGIIEIPGKVARLMSISRPQWIARRHGRLGEENAGNEA